MFGVGKEAKPRYFGFYRGVLCFHVFCSFSQVFWEGCQKKNGAPVGKPPGCRLLFGFSHFSPRGGLRTADLGSAGDLFEAQRANPSEDLAERLHHPGSVAW